MDYKSIVDEIESICRKNFDMDAFHKIGSISRRINNIFKGYSANDKNLKLQEYLDVKNYLEEVAFFKLKEKLGYEDEIIQKIVLSYISIFDSIAEIYIVDGYMAVKMMDRECVDVNSPQFIPEGNFSDITSSEFNNIEGPSGMKPTFIKGINEYFRALFDSLGVIKLKSSGYIAYDIPNLYIFINSSLRDLDEIRKSGSNATFKMLVKYCENIYYFDVKVRDGQVILQRNDFEVNKISEVLNSPSKIKKKQDV